MIATAIGSLPGTDMAGALRAMADTFDELVPLPELPARGPHAGMIGRAVGVLDGLPVDLAPEGWRLADAADSRARAARRLWSADLDQTEETLAGAPAHVKVGLCGPLTLLAGLHLRRGESVLADSGARRDVVAALAEAVSTLHRDLTRRMPEVTWVLQVDEPGAASVLGGTVPTASGLRRHPPIEAEEAVAAWRSVVAAWPQDRVWWHGCGREVPWTLLERAAMTCVVVDVTALGPRQLDGLAAWLDAGHRAGLGVVATQQPDRLVRPDEMVARVVGLARRPGIDPSHLQTCLLTPACGLAGWSRAAAARQCEELSRAVPLVAERLADLS